MASQSTTDDLDFDLQALKDRYRQERDKRLRADGEHQYQEVEADFAEFYESDPHSPPVMRAAIDDEIEVAVLGGGFAGLMAGAHLRQVGVSDFRIIEAGGDFGGTWYWNRYPGIQCDNEAYCYMPLLEETGYVPSEKYAHGGEIYSHCQRIGRHFDLYDRALFGTRVNALRWDEALKRWRIATHHGDDIKARFVIMASGYYNRAKLPGIAGIKSFKGHSFHTSRWDYAYTGGDETGGLVKLADKRVAIIGTGATAIQCIPHLGRFAKQLYVFQRTPSAVDERGNRPTDPEWVRSLKPGWTQQRRNNFHQAVTGEPVEEDLVSDGWTVINRRVAARMADYPEDKRTPELRAKLVEVEDYRRMNEIRDRVDQLVTRKDNAEGLKSWYRWNCKRPTFHDDYLPTFNRANVTLVDVGESKGVDRISEKGVVANGKEYEVDCIIYASGFEITTEVKRRIGIAVIEGRDGESLYDHWKNGFRTLHGFTTHGFPNMFHTGYTQVGVFANLTTMLDDQTSHIAYIIRRASDLGAKIVEATVEAENAWRDHMKEVAVSNTDFLIECTPGYYNNEGNPVRSHVGEVYGRGYVAFNAVLEAWRDKGDLEGLRLEN